VEQIYSRFLHFFSDTVNSPPLLLFSFLSLERSPATSILVLFSSLFFLTCGWDLKQVLIGFSFFFFFDSAVSAAFRVFPFFFLLSLQYLKNESWFFCEFTPPSFLKTSRGGALFFLFFFPLLRKKRSRTPLTFFNRLSLEFSFPFGVPLRAATTLSNSPFSPSTACGSCLDGANSFILDLLFDFSWFPLLLSSQSAVS